MTKAFHLLCVLMLAAAAICKAQAPHIQWQKVMGNENGDYPKKILETADGGFVVLGYREGNVVPAGNNSAFIDDIISVAKFDASGNLQWENAVLGGAQYMGDLVQTRDGGYLVVTSAWVEECNAPVTADVYAIRLNAKGEVVWKKHYGGSNTDDGYAVDITPDGDYVIAGSTRSNDISGYHGNNDWWVIKIDDSGNLLWQKILGGSMDEFAYSVVVAADGSSLIGGYTDSNDGDVSGRKGPRDAWLVKLSPTGAIQWKRCFGGSMYETCNNISLSHNGGFILAVQANSSDGDVTGLHNALGPFSDFWVVDIAANGNINWSKCYGGLYNETPYDIQQTRDGGYVLTGNSESANGDLTCNSGSEDIWLIKITGSGTLQWQKSFGGALYDIGFSVQQLKDNSFILAGQTCSKQIAGYHPGVSGSFGTCADYLLIKLSAEGAPANPLSVTIDPNTAQICQGQSATLFASASSAGVNTTYQWTKNGAPIGENSPYFTATGLNANDLIRCTITSEGSCETGGAMSHDEVRISIKAPSAQPEISIKSSADVLCDCNAVSFRATVKNKGLQPNYTWKVNGKRKWNNQDVFVADKLNPGDVVICEYTDASHCLPGGKITSNSIQFLYGSAGVAEISISSGSDAVCEGSPVRINAAVSNGGFQPTYRWTLNGQVVGTNADSLILASPRNGDRIRCTVNVDPEFSCISNQVVSSEELHLTVKSKGVPSITVSSTSNQLCKGEEVVLAAESQNAGIMPGYRWMINGLPASETSAIFKSSSISNNDEIYCIVTPGNDVCDATPISSERISFTVYDIPRVQIFPLDTVVKRGAVVHLSASVTGNYASLNWEPASLIVDPESLHSTTIPLRESAEVKLTVRNEHGCSVSAASKIVIRSALFMPNAFTPNADGNNDVFRIPEGTTIDLLEFSVFDRWGNKVFTTNDINKGWNGSTAVGKPCDNGTYVYLVKGSDDKGAVMQKGTVMVIR